MKYVYLGALLLSFFIHFPVTEPYAEETLHGPFKLSVKMETLTALTSVSCTLTGCHLHHTMSVRDPLSLKRNDVNPLERFACGYYSKKFSYFSDITREATYVILALSMVPHFNDSGTGKYRALLTDMVMFLEAQTIIGGLTACAKGLSERPRPYVSNSDRPLAERRNTESFESFWSGHSARAFTTAVFTGYVYQNRYPGSRLIRPIWICGITCATATGVLRVRSGKHFPTDVIVGSAMGSLVGWMIPRLHRAEKPSVSLTPFPGTAHGLCLTCMY